MNLKLKAKIIEKFGSQVEFAKAIGEHEAIISRVIHGHHDLTDKERRKWALVLGQDDPQNLFCAERKINIMER